MYWFYLPIFLGVVVKRISNYVVSSRAIENKVHVVSADRIGTERGSSFAGLSKIVNASGDILALASDDRDEIIYGEVDVESTRQKHVTVVPGECELDYLEDRRPELYGVITQPIRDV